jgi:lipoate-protein ligase B
MPKFFSLRYEGSEIIPYSVAWKLQKSLVEKRARDEIEDTILFVEHPPTITRGRGLQFTGLPRDQHMPLDQITSGTEYFEIERGGDLTWHGPGQLVIYPIVKLDGKGEFPHHDVTGFLRKLESALIALLQDFKLKGEMREKATGVWVGDRKVASLGIAVSKWVTYHGAAINVVNDPSSFLGFNPCGFDAEVMTSLSALGVALQSDWRENLEVRLRNYLTSDPMSSKIEVYEISLTP